MNKTCVRFGNILALTYVTCVQVARMITLRASGITICSAKFVKSDSSGLFQINAREHALDIQVMKQREGVSANFGVEIDKLHVLQKEDILLQLLGPGVGFSGLVPWALSKPRSDEGRGGTGVSNKILQPLEPPQSKFSVHGEQGTLFQNLSISPGSVFIVVFVVFMSSASQKGACTKNNKSGEPVTFIFGKHKRLER